MREDVARAQAMARGLIWLGSMTILLTIFLWIATPGQIQPMFYEPAWYETWLVPICIVAELVALGWMIRIYRSRPGLADADWRYRS